MGNWDIYIECMRTLGKTRGKGGYNDTGKRLFFPIPRGGHSKQRDRSRKCPKWQRREKPIWRGPFPKRKNCANSICRPRVSQLALGCTGTTGEAGGLLLRVKEEEERNEEMLEGVDRRG